MAKIKSKTIYVNKELEKRMNAKDKAGAKAHSAKKKEDKISKAHKASSKSPKSMFKESMKHFSKLVNKKKS